MPGARHQDRGGAFDRRLQHETRAARRRNRLHRPAAIGRLLSEHARDHQRRGGHRFGRDPSGLRLPVRKRRLRGARREERVHLRRPARRDDPDDGRQGFRDQGDEGRGRALRAGIRRAAGTRSGRELPHRQGNRLPGDHQGLRRRRRPRHARRAHGSIAAERDQRDQVRGARRVRQRSGLHGEVPREAAAHRVPGARATTTATWCISANAIARCSAATRRSSRRLPPRA